MTMRKSLAVLLLGVAAAACSSNTGLAPTGWMYVRVSVADTLGHPIAQMPVSVQIVEATNAATILGTSFGVTNTNGLLQGLVYGSAIEVAAVARAQATPPTGSPYSAGSDSVNAQFHMSPTPPDTANITIVLK